jgi:hypothetical protein
VTKIAIEPVWWLPGVARRFGVARSVLRRTLFEQTGGMYPELITRNDLEVFLPPIGGQTVYVLGRVTDLANPDIELSARIHDECNGSDVFGSDICTCRPYLTHAIEDSIACAQRGGVGLIVYSRKEGRALGEVTKFLVYNARKRQAGGDRIRPLVIETHPIDHGLLRRIAEHAGLGIPRLSERGDGANFNVPEAQRGRGGPGAGVLVEACGQTNGIGKREPKGLNRTKAGGRQSRP